MEASVFLGQKNIIVWLFTHLVLAHFGSFSPALLKWQQMILSLDKDRPPVLPIYFLEGWAHFQNFQQVCRHEYNVRYPSIFEFQPSTWKLDSQVRKKLLKNNITAPGKEQGQSVTVGDKGTVPCWWSEPVQWGFIGLRENQLLGSVCRLLTWLGPTIGHTHRIRGNRVLFYTSWIHALGICTGGQSILGNNVQQSIDKNSPSCFLIRGPRIGTFLYFIFPIFPPCICDDISAAVEELGWPATKLRLNGFTCLSVTVILIVAVIGIGIGIGIGIVIVVVFIAIFVSDLVIISGRGEELSLSSKYSLQVIFTVLAPSRPLMNWSFAYQWYLVIVAIFHVSTKKLWVK